MSTEWQEDDEQINVILTKRDYRRLRRMLEREATLSTMGKWVFSTGFALVGGLISIMVFFDGIKEYLKSLVKWSVS